MDVSQSAGLYPIELEQWGVGGLAFTGHKSLLGPTGIGGLVLSPSVNQSFPTRYGGTGVDSINPVHTMDYPHRLEAGTINLLGVLGAGPELGLSGHAGAPAGSEPGARALGPVCATGWPPWKGWSFTAPKALVSTCLFLSCNVGGIAGRRRGRHFGRRL